MKKLLFVGLLALVALFAACSEAPAASDVTTASVATDTTIVETTSDTTTTDLDAIDSELEESVKAADEALKDL